MKPERLLVLIVAGIVGAIVGYLLMSFICWNFNPETWASFVHPMWNGEKYEMKLDTNISGFIRFIGLLAIAGASSGCVYGAWKITKETR